MISTSILITYENKNITQDIAPFLLSFSFNDNSGGNADDISLSLEDRKGTWINHWLPSKGDKIQASIESNQNILPLGIFEVDEINYSCPPRVLSIKAISSGVKNNLTSEKKNRAWENVNLSRIAKDLAANANLGVYFGASQDYFFERKEQSHQSDLEFLKELCANYNLDVKINDGKIIIHEINSSENFSSEINSQDKKIISWKFTSKSAGIFKAAKVSYHHAQKGETIEAEYEDDSVEGSEKVLEISERVENNSQALDIAKEKLQNANAKEISGSISLIGDTRFLAGVNILCSDFGMFSGKYFVERVTHNISRSGYQTELFLQMGQDAKKNTKSRKKNAQSSKGVSEIYYEGEEYYRRSE